MDGWKGRQINRQMHTNTYVYIYIHIFYQERIHTHIRTHLLQLCQRMEQDALPPHPPLLVPVPQQMVPCEGSTLQDTPRNTTEGPIIFFLLLLPV